MAAREPLCEQNRPEYAQFCSHNGDILAFLARPTLVLMFAAALSACFGSPTPAAVAPLPDELPPVDSDATVRVADNVYEPAELVVEAGTEVTWRWEGSIGHDVVGDRFASELRAEGTFSHTFTEEGVHEYVCTLHDGMVGTVIVVPPDAG